MIIVGNGTLIALDDANTFLPDGALCIVDDVITEIDSTSELRRKYPGAEFVDAS